MELVETKKLIEQIDLHYRTDYSKRKDLIKEWHKHLKLYKTEEILNKFEDYCSNSKNSNYPPKVWDLIRGLVKEDLKVDYDSIRTSCMYCKKWMGLNEIEQHEDRCRSIDFIKRNVKKYLGKDINESEYFLMNEEDLQKRWEKIAEIIIKNSEDEQEVSTLKKYFESKS